MQRPLDALSVQELDALIANHRRLGATDRPVFLAALEERSRRGGNGLDFATSRRVIQAAAKEGRFLSYKDLADASGADWGKVHYALGRHLGDLIEYAHRSRLPLFVAIVVNKPNVETGRMEPDTLKGFVNAARELGYLVEDDEAFLRDQQARTFAWGAATPASAGATST